MEGVYKKILRQAYHLTKGYRTFWLAGLFLVWPALLRFAFLLFATMPLWNKEGMATQGIEDYQKGDLWVGFVSLVVIFVLAILYFRSKAVLMLGVSQLRGKSQMESSKAVAESKPHSWPLLKLGATLYLIILFVTSFLLSPVLYLNAENYSNRAGILGLLATIIYLPMVCYLYYTSIIAPMLMVLRGMTLTNSLRVSYDLVRKNWPILIIFSLILLGVELVSLAISTLLLVITIMPFVLLVPVFYDNGGTGLILTLQTLAGIVGFMVFFMSQAVAVSFQRIAWTIMFFEIIKPVKAQETPETASVPEIV